MDELTRLAIKYGTDKWGKHHYTPVYYDLFKDRRNEVKKVLEIGPAEGAGLFMFRDFFPNATIYGFEIDSVRFEKLQGLERIEVFIADQSKSGDMKALMEVIGDVDIVIDDGSHKTSDQLFSLMNIWPRTNTYIIEDVHEPEALEEYINNYFEYTKQVRVVKCSSRYDDNLIIINE